MLNEIKNNINERIKNQPDYRCASADEVRICWMVMEIELLKKKIGEAKNCLVCAAIADPIEVINNTYKILI